VLKAPGFRQVVLLEAVVAFATPLIAARAEVGSTPSGAVITVRAHEDLGPVNHLVFGQNLEAADSQFIFTSDSNSIPGRTGDGVWDPRIPPGAPVAETVEVARELGMGMLRYSGGCLTHNFDWKRAVGPVEDRPDFTFGIDEFIAYCRAVGTEPLITVSAYVGGPAEAAELVEYLNAQATPDHHWAQLREQWGHPEPYGLRYLKMGNESDHGNHDVTPHRRLSAEEYGQWFNECSAAMRGIDSDVELGALMGTGTGPFDPWNRVVLASTASTADFIVVHTYAVGYWGQGDIPGERLMRACMAAGEQLEGFLADYRAEIVEHSGKAKPLAITEYNAGFVQEEPVPYRFTLGAGLFAANWIRILLQPETNCLRNSAKTT
jgi:alpha-N-arabinofuranosidase